ncbi:MAG: cytochrome c3 family protein [Candidatus Glassbacteria bacterium]|nr:cytochrome c3 family protein [Candidatus Glassbacteria bacterium]
MNLIKSKLHLIIIAIAVLAVSGHYVWHLDINTGYAPDQPIPFSHKIHAGDYKMDCLYCHGAAEKGPHAGIPPMNVCMGCHSVVGLDKDNIKMLGRMYNEGKTVQWERVHRLPDHVYFSHKWHLKAGVDCMECHGDVAVMPLISQVKRLEMGDCIECHRQSQFHQAYLDSTGALTSAGIGIYERYPYLKYVDLQTLNSSVAAGQNATGLDKTPERLATGVIPHHNAMTQCSTCHQ